jgi:hypothetical protein
MLLHAASSKRTPCDESSHIAPKCLQFIIQIAPMIMFIHSESKELYVKIVKM